MSMVAIMVKYRHNGDSRTVVVHSVQLPSDSDEPLLPREVAEVINYSGMESTDHLLGLLFGRNVGQAPWVSI
jgi:hypothetical protein